jgi:CheY-like chemotaxis protein
LQRRGEIEDRLRRLSTSPSPSDAALLACVSHEMRTPMNAIVGYVELLASLEPDPPARQAWTERLRWNSDHLLIMVRNLVDLSAVFRGELVVDAASCDLLEILRDVACVMDEMAYERVLDLSITAEPSLARHVVTDGGRLRQILANVIGNAVRFTDSGGVVVHVDGDGRMLKVRIRDTGPGIEPDEIESIFEPFYRGRRGGMRETAGLGLGLAVARRLARCLGGDIYVESRVGQGSTFVVTVEYEAASGDSETVPQRVPLPRDARGSDDARSGLDGMRIHVVDDNPDNVLIAETLLTQAGASVTVSRNGAEAVDDVGASMDDGCEPDVVLMDIMMPVMDGYEATRRLLEPHRGPDGAEPFGRPRRLPRGGMRRLPDEAHHAQDVRPDRGGLHGPRFLAGWRVSRRGRGFRRSATAAPRSPRVGASRDRERVGERRRPVPARRNA